MIVMDCGLEQLAHALEPVNGMLRACAYDVGAASGALEHLIRVAPVFRVAEAGAGLVLVPGKGVIVPVADAGSDRMQRRVRWRLA